MTDLKETKIAIWETILSIKNNHNKNQPWLTPRESIARPNSEAALKNRRADQNGSIRNLKLSDMGTIKICERLWVAHLLGISVIKVDGPLYQGKGGTIFHNEIENLMPSHFNNARRNRNETFVKLLSIGKYTDSKFTGKKYNGIYGQFDSFSKDKNLGLELKSVPETFDFPEEVSPKALVQGALYAYGLKQKGLQVDRWSWLYLPLDLNKLIPQDISTYRVFIKEWEELEEIALDSLRRAKDISLILTKLDGDFNAIRDQLECFDKDCKLCSI